MRLSRYLAQNHIPVAQFAAETGVIAQTVYRWANGERFPRPDAMRRIKAATGGKVTPADFYAGFERTAAGRPVEEPCEA